MRKSVVVAALTAVAFFGVGIVGGGVASAAPLHQHTLTTPSGPVPVALGFCKNPSLFAFGERNHFVFDHFHDWIHLGPVPTTVERTDCAPA